MCVGLNRIWLVGNKVHPEKVLLLFWVEGFLEVGL